ncbi:hypothetical protein QA584_17190 [Anaerocolumna sp. AGMB13025]|uniref:discoidin domain-containing protein n=1 Tax=Anaerocolumna sp. AGMB13025 TaxID=3039116 RepID=UPI00241F4C21|nr:discoidin domain-containing protein [Anaerocolumna sp. AGMB13025]WFR55335.1 hypothetical protein QA584_17190 [Anaerocolumna sp. AGMB13025]
MKRLKGLLIFVLVFISTIMFSNTKSFAEVIQYTDNVIPAMTSNTLPSGKASASSIYSSNGTTYPAYLAFDHDSSTVSSAWASALNTPYGWLEYDFPEYKCIAKYSLVSRNPVSSIKELPKNWTFEAYNEELSKWIVLDTQSNITNWALGETKEFTFQNTTLYKKYRINITANGDGTHPVIIGEIQMMETVSAPINLTASVNNSAVNLSWDSVTNSQYYNIKRSTTPGGPYDKIIPYEPTVTGSSITFVDNDVTPGTTYYFVVSAIISGIESPDSNEVSATPTGENTPPDHTGNTATLLLTMTNGDDKVYNVSLAELDAFLYWYDIRSNGEGRAYYTFTKTTNIAPYLSVKEYVTFDKISSFEVKEYNQ